METIRQYAVVFSNGETYVTWSENKAIARLEAAQVSGLKICGIISLGKTLTNPLQEA